MTASPLALALATARLTELVTEGEIFTPVRRRVHAWALGAPDYSFRERVDTLITCPMCASVWVAAGLLAVKEVPVLRHVVPLLAVSQAAMLLESGRRAMDR